MSVVAYGAKNNTKGSKGNRGAHFQFLPATFVIVCQIRYLKVIDNMGLIFQTILVSVKTGSRSPGKAGFISLVLPIPLVSSERYLRGHGKEPKPIEYFSNQPHAQAADTVGLGVYHQKEGSWRGPY